MRMISLLDLATPLSAVGGGLVAGIFFAFSTFTPRGGRLPSFPSASAQVRGRQVIVEHKECAEAEAVQGGPLAPSVT